MTTNLTPWDDIETPGADYNVRLTANSKQIPLYWGRDSEGHCLFIVELAGDHSAQFRESRTSVRGIGVDLRSLGPTETQGLVLKLEQHVDQDLFLGLCDTLSASLRDVPDSASALSVALTHIGRWKTFLASRRVRLLSLEEIYGLYAELQFLRLLYSECLPEEAALDAWCGPDGVHQDFIFGNKAVEIKALSGKERSMVRISSEDQLETLCDRLFLKVFHLNAISESDHALSLNETVRQVAGELSAASALEKFFTQLAAYGYVELRDYDEPRLVVTGQKTYRVTEEFPRIVRSGLPDGLTRVGYAIELESIAKFECETAEVWRDA